MGDSATRLQGETLGHYLLWLTFEGDDGSHQQDPKENLSQLGQTSVAPRTGFTENVQSSPSVSASTSVASSNISSLFARPGSRLQCSRLDSKQFVSVQFGGESKGDV